MLKRLFHISVILLVFSSGALADMINIGVPYIHNYLRKEYKGGTQNWAIAQDERGFMYFGNNDGLLLFDGVSWQLHRMVNSSIVRSIFISESKQVYIGAYNELGKMVLSRNGKMEFKSLKKFLPAEFLNFDDVWNITSFKNKIVFQSYNFAFLFTNDSTVSIIKAPSRFQNSYLVNNRLYFNDREKGLMEYSGDKLDELTGCGKIKGEEVWSILPFNKGKDLMIFTLSKGIFIYNGQDLKEWAVPVNEILKQKQIFSAIVIQDKYYAVGTIQDGIIIIGEDGHIVQHINRQKGLQNNTILKVFSDRDGNLWLGLDNGIDFVNVNSPITFLQQSDGIGAGYSTIIHNGKIYLGTNQGLFVKDWGNEQQNKEFRLIPGTNGQVWYLGVHDNVLLCGHNNGTFIIEGEKARQISQIPGAWKFHELKRFPGYLIGGTYSGLTLYKKQNGSWVFSGKINGFNESFRVFEEDENGDLWMSHGFKGIFKIPIGNSLNQISSYRFYTSKDGLPSNYNLNIFKINGKIVVASSAGFFEYNKEKDRFESSEYFNQLLSPLKDVSYLKEDNAGNIWYMVWDMGKTKAGVFRIQEDNSYKNITAPFGLLTGKFISGFESVYPFSDNHVFFGTEAGFAHYSPLSSFNHIPDFETYISRATALYLDSTFFYGNYSQKQVKDALSGSDLPVAESAERVQYNFPFKENTFRFSFTSPVYDNQENIEYSFRLSGYNNKWSKWSNIPFNEYANLPPGEYTFSVKARNQMGIESTTDNLSFSVLPPWYRTFLAFILYLILIVLVISILIWYFLKRIESANKRERLKREESYLRKENEYKQEALISEKEIINLRNEKLKIEMIHRDKELANQTMDLIRKNKFLQRIKDELETLQIISSDENVKDKISSIMNKIDRDIDHKKQWEIFESAFDEVHEDFLKRLKHKFPSLTPKELKLCAYLRMNISTKEIAPLMNISVRGVEICRYRVRKKLNIDRDQNLTSMIIDL